MLGGNLGSVLYGDVSVIGISQFETGKCKRLLESFTCQISTEVIFLNCGLSQISVYYEFASVVESLKKS